MVQGKGYRGQAKERTAKKEMQSIKEDREVVFPILFFFASVA
jgi:hypothetical protein